jgi:hypothetical protein
MLSRNRLDFLTHCSADPCPRGEMVRVNMNKELSDLELDSLTADRIMQGKDTALLREEYDRRLREQNQ